MISLRVGRIALTPPSVPASDPDVLGAGLNCSESKPPERFTGLDCRSFSLRPGTGHQRENRSAGGASGQRPNHLGVDRRGGADCPSVPSGLTASVESGGGGFFAGSAIVRGPCNLRAVSFGCGRRLVDCLGFSGGTTGAASGNSSATTPGPLGDSTHRKKVCLISSIAAHPARPKLADKTIRTSATRP